MAQLHCSVRCGRAVPAVMADDAVREGVPRVAVMGPIQGYTQGTSNEARAIRDIKTG